MMKIAKKTFWAVLAIVALIMSVAGYQYLTVAVAPEYDPETMPLNYEIVGSGDKNMVLIHGLAGSKNYWKRGLE